MVGCRLWLLFAPAGSAEEVAPAPRHSAIPVAVSAGAFHVGTSGARRGDGGGCNNGSMPSRGKHIGVAFGFGRARSRTAARAATGNRDATRPLDSRDAASRRVVRGIEPVRIPSQRVPARGSRCRPLVISLGVVLREGLAERASQRSMANRTDRWPGGKLSSVAISGELRVARPAFEHLDTTGFPGGPRPRLRGGNVHSSMEERRQVR